MCVVIATTSAVAGVLINAKPSAIVAVSGFNSTGVYLFKKENKIKQQVNFVRIN